MSNLVEKERFLLYVVYNKEIFLKYLYILDYAITLIPQNKLLQALDSKF